jgi:hypothetical protein
MHVVTMTGKVCREYVYGGTDTLELKIGFNNSNYENIIATAYPSVISQ